MTQTTRRTPTVRHPNQRALTVNTRRVNTNPEASRQRVARAVMPDLCDTDSYGSPSARLSDNFHLLLNGFSRAGGIS